MKAWTMLMAVLMAAAVCGPAWAGPDTLCNGVRPHQKTYPIPKNMVMKLELEASAPTGVSDCSKANFDCRGDYVVDWSTECDSKRKTGTLLEGESESFYMPYCHSGGQVLVRATAGCLQVIETTSQGF